MTGASAQYRRHACNLCAIIWNENESLPINERSSEDLCLCELANGEVARSEAGHLVRLALYLIPSKSAQMRLRILISVLAVALAGTTHGAVTLPVRTVFKGQDRFEQLVV